MSAVRSLVVVVAVVTGCGDGGRDLDAGVDATADAAVTGDPLDPAVLHDVAIDIAVADLAAFDEDQTVRVPCDLRYDGVVLARSGCRKKGGIGSVDPVIGKPAFSIKLDDTIPGQKLGGLDKLVLNNAIQDASLVHEHVAYEVFRRAGVVAHRTAFAQVSLNGEARGIYLVVEPVEREFLRARFGAGNDGGNLYEAAVVDFAIDPAALDLKDPVGRSRADLDAAAAAVMTAPDASFAAEVGARIDLAWFTRFFAVEIALAAEDGYGFGRNNYYLYHRPDTDRFVFLPHGQDVVLINPGLDVDYPPSGRLAARLRALPSLAAPLDAAVRAAVEPGGAFDPAVILERIDAARAVVATTTRTDDFTAGDLASMARTAPIVRSQVGYRALVLAGTAAPPTCGDGFVQGAEQCDDGGTVDGDGCDQGCLPECATVTDAGGRWRLCPARRDWATAVADCTRAGGAIAIPSDAADATALAARIRRHLGAADAWIGLTDVAAEGVWRTPSGALAPYLGFGAREPNGDAGENCAVVDTGMRGGFRDQPCDAGYAALCRLP